MNSVIAKNRFEKTFGISMWACVTYGFNMPHWYITVTDNTMINAKGAYQICEAYQEAMQKGIPVRHFIEGLS